MKITLIEIDELSPWEIDDLTQRAKSYFAPYIGKDAKRFGQRTINGRRVCRCFRCGGWAQVTGVLVTQILCDVCGTYAYQLNYGGAVRVYVENSVQKHSNLIELKLNTDDIIVISQSTPVDLNNSQDTEWLNLILGL